MFIRNQSPGCKKNWGDYCSRNINHKEIPMQITVLYVQNDKQITVLDLFGIDSKGLRHARKLY